MPVPNAPMLSALRLVDPAAFASQVRAAIASQRNITRAARLLGVGRATLTRWLDETPAIVDGIEMQRVGAPKGRTVSRGSGRARKKN